MKTRTLLLSATSAAALFAYALPAAAQTEDRAPTAPDEPAGETANTGEKDRLSAVYATLASHGEGSEITGTLKFTISGSAASVSGRITGLDAGETYQLTTAPAKRGESAETPAEDTDEKPDIAPPPSEAGAPDAGKPIAPAPDAGTPNAGQPDGQTRPNASTPSALNPTDKHVIGTVVADSNGTANVNAVLRSDATARGLRSLIGKTVTLRRGEGAEMKSVATGVISAKEGKTPAPAERAAEAGATIGAAHDHAAPDMDKEDAHDASDADEKDN